MVEFVTQLDLGVVVRFQRYGRVDAVALEMAVVTEGVAVLVHRVEAYRDVLVHCLASIQPLRACRFQEPPAKIPHPPESRHRARHGRCSTLS